MGGQLQLVDGDSPTRCAFCSNEAAGPCGFAMFLVAILAVLAAAVALMAWLSG